jgi:hypothetical protein
VKRDRIIYWCVTLFLVLGLATGSILEILQLKIGVEPFEVLGFPLYLAPFLGTCRILAFVVILTPSRWVRLKEWAYTGLVFDVVGAIYAHFAAMRPLSHNIFPIVTLLLILTSYYFHHRLLRNNIHA